MPEHLPRANLPRIAAWIQYSWLEELSVLQEQSWRGGATVKPFGAQMIPLQTLDTRHVAAEVVPQFSILEWECLFCVYWKNVTCL